MLYLVNCKVIKSYYLDESETSEVNHIVDADDTQSAMDKVSAFYTAKDSPYYITYWVNFNYCNEVIS